MRKFLSKVVDIFARLNRDVVGGIWQTALIMPLDCAMFVFFTGEPSYPNLDYRFYIFFAIYTLLFLFGYAVFPIIKKRKFLNLLDGFVLEGKITKTQQQKILHIISDVPRYAPLWSKDGFVLFLMENVYCLSIIFVFFGGEGIINACLNGTAKIMAILHLCFAVGCLILENKLDKYLAQKMRKKYKIMNSKMFYGINKQITTQLIADITGDSSSNNLMNLHLEEMLEDITDILDVSNAKEEAKKVKQRKFGKTGMPKGRLEKIKNGILLKKKEKKKKHLTNNIKKKKDKRLKKANNKQKKSKK